MVLQLGERMRRIWYIPLWWAARLCAEREKVALDLARERWFDPADPPRGSDLRSQYLYALCVPAFRTLLFHRLSHGTSFDRVAAGLLKRAMPGERTLELGCERIGGGLRVAHGYSTVIYAERMGRDCTVHQNVTVGLSHVGRVDRWPVIGDRVFIGAGAAVLGGVTLGDDCVVGANAVVTRDVAPGVTVAGVPARPVARTGGAALEAA